MLKVLITCLMWQYRIRGFGIRVVWGFFASCSSSSFVGALMSWKGGNVMPWCFLVRTDCVTNPLQLIFLFTEIDFH